MGGGKEITVGCMKVQQGGMEFYVFVLNSRTLRDIAYVSVRDSANPKAYQRYFSKKRAREVGEYIKKPRATFPNSIIINFNENKVRVNIDPGGQHGTMVIPKEKEVAWIIDGQHRLYGFENSEGKEFDLLVAAFVGLSLGDQATIFKVINSEQKGVNPSLIYDLIGLTMDAEARDERAHEIVKALNEENDSPWKNQIKMLGRGQGIVSQAAFIGELKGLLEFPILKEYPAGEQIKIIKDYFGALKELFPEAWGSKRHVLSKTLGLAAVLLIMPKVLIHCQVRNSFTQDTMKEILEDLTKLKVPTERGTETLDFSSSQLGKLGGRKGQRELSKMLEGSLPPLRPTT